MDYLKPRRYVKAGYTPHAEQPANQASANAPGYRDALGQRVGTLTPAQQRSQAGASSTESLAASPGTGYDYNVTIACPLTVYKAKIASHSGFYLAKTEAEPAVDQWSQTDNDGHTLLTATVLTDEPKKLVHQFHSVPGSALQVEAVTPVAKDSRLVQEAFIPVQLAIQVGEQLGWPSEGYFYHFIDSQLQHEYKIQGKEKWLYHQTDSDQQNLSDEPQYPHLLDTILLPWQQHGATVNNQHLVYLPNKLTLQQLAGVDATWLDRHGLKLDMDALSAQTRPDAPRRKRYQVQSGDTLSQIAAAHDLTLRELVALNPIYRGKEDQIKVGATLYLAPVSTYNQLADIGSDSKGRMLANAVGKIAPPRSPSPIPVVNVGRYDSAKDFIALSPVRYALDAPVRDGAAQLHPLPDHFPGGKLTGIDQPYTLRQLRDGWLYVVTADPDNPSQYRLDEYQITGQDLQRIPGHDDATRQQASPEKAKGFLLYPDNTKLYLSYSQQRWTQRVCDYFCQPDTDRDHIMRTIDLAEVRQGHYPPHTAAQTELASCVADITPTLPELNKLFQLSCAPLEGETSDYAFLSPKPAGTEPSYTYGVPGSCEQIMVALDDPFGDLHDLYLRLLKPLIASTPTEEEQRKLIIGEQVRQMARVTPHPDELSDKVKQDPRLLIPLEQALAQYLRLNTLLKSAQHMPLYNQPDQYYADRLAQRQAELEKALKSEYGFTPTQRHQDEWKRANPLHDEVDWAALDAFYQDYLDNQLHYTDQLPGALDNVIVAIKALGSEPLDLGLDVKELPHMLYLVEFLSEIMPTLQASATTEEEQEKIAQLAVQQDPDNLLALTLYGFSREFKTEVDRFMQEKALFTGAADGAAWLGRVADLETYFSFSDATKSPLYQMVFKLRSSISVLTAEAGIKLVDSFERYFIKLVTHLYQPFQKFGPYSPIVNSLYLGWFNSAMLGNNIEVNPHFASQQTKFKQSILDRKQNIDKARAKIDRLNSKLKNETSKAKIKAHKKEIKKLYGVIRRNINAITNKLKSAPQLFKSIQTRIGKPIQNGGAMLGAHLKQGGKFMGKQYNSSGGFASVVALLNLINMMGTIQTFSQTMQEVGFDSQDRADGARIAAASIAWSVSATAEVFRGASWDLIKNDKGIFNRSVKEVLDNADDLFSKQQVQLARAFSKRTATMAVAGFIGASLEICQTWIDFENANFKADKALLLLKGSVLAGQGMIFGAISIATGLSKAGLVSISKAFAMWMGAALLWLGIAYLAVTVLIMLFQKSPLESWVRQSCWGKEPNKSWNAEREYRALMKLLRQPSIQLESVNKSNPTRVDNGYVIHYQHQKQLTLQLPMVTSEDEIQLGVRIKQIRAAEQYTYHGPRHQIHTIDISEAVISTGSWQIKESHSEFQLFIPHWVEAEDSYEILLQLPYQDPYDSDPINIDVITGNTPEPQLYFYACGRLGSLDVKAISYQESKKLKPFANAAMLTDNQ